MTTVEQEPVVTQRVGKFAFEVVAAEPTPDVEGRRQHRREALTAWLLAEWRREQMRRVAEEN